MLGFWLIQKCQQNHVSWQRCCQDTWPVCDFNFSCLLYCWEETWAMNLCYHVSSQIHVYMSALTVAGAGCQTAFSQGAKWPWKPFAWPQSVLTCRDESGASWLIFASIDEIIDVAYRNPDPEIWKEVKYHFILMFGSSIGFSLHAAWQAPIIGRTN